MLTWLTWTKLISDQKYVEMDADEVEPEEPVFEEADPVTVHLLPGNKQKD